MNKHLKIAGIVMLCVAAGMIGLAGVASAEVGKPAVWMSITNTKTGTMKTLKWEPDGYEFEKKVTISVDDMKDRKIKQVFGTNEFRFTWQLVSYENAWQHFIVTIGTKAEPGRPINVFFTHEEEREGSGSILHGNGVEAMNLASMNVSVNAEKMVYTEGERATVFISFVDAYDKFVDPDSMITYYNSDSIGTLLQKKKVGSYIYTTPPLERGEKEIIVLAVKNGYNIGIGSIDFTILPDFQADKHLTRNS